MKDTERQPIGDELDEALEETFPASDPPANTVETGIRIDGVDVPDPPVKDNRDARRFELHKDGHVAFLNYIRKRETLALVHTEVPSALRGQHLGDALVEAAFAEARAEGLRVIPMCSFVKAYLRKHPELA
jgi:predicted GNAT family acetyltransferase